MIQGFRPREYLFSFLRGKWNQIVVNLTTGIILLWIRKLLLIEISCTFYTGHGALDLMLSSASAFDTLTVRPAGQEEKIAFPWSVNYFINIPDK